MFAMLLTSKTIRIYKEIIVMNLFIHFYFNLLFSEEKTIFYFGCTTWEWEYCIST